MNYFEEKELILTEYLIEMKEILKLAENGDAYAQYELGCRFEDGEFGLQKKLDEAFKWYEKAVNGGDKDACYSLGSFYARGIVVEQNIKKAIDLYKLAFEDDFMMAGFIVGNFYYNGIGIARDEKVGRYFLEKAAKGSGLSVERGIATIYMDGHGVENDKEKEIIWLKRAAEKGDMSALEALSKYTKYNDLGN